jgi:hypothetical protein
MAPGNEDMTPQDYYEKLLRGGPKRPQGLIPLDAAEELWEQGKISGTQPSTRKNAQRDGYVMAHAVKPE